MRTYYTTAESTWGTQYGESYTGSNSSSSEVTTYSSYSGSVFSSTEQTGQSYYSASRETNNVTRNYSTTLIGQSSTISYSGRTTTSQSVTEYSSDTSQTIYGSRSVTGEYSSYQTWVFYQNTYVNLTGSSTSLSQATSFSSTFSYSETTLRSVTYGSLTYATNSTYSTSGATFSVTATTGSGSTGTLPTSTFAVGSYQITITSSTWSETNTTTSLSSTRTYGTTSTASPVVRTSTSLVGYTDSTSKTITFSTRTSSAASETITVTMNPKVERMVAYERGTGERLFAITYEFENTTKLLSEALSEFNTYTESALTVVTDTDSSEFVGATFSSTTASSSFASVYPAFTQLRPNYTILPAPVGQYDWFGGYQQGTTSVTFDEGPFDVTKSNVTAVGYVTQRFTQSPSATTTYNATLMRINPLSYLSFGDTSTDYQNLVLTYNTTSLATP